MKTFIVLVTLSLLYVASFAVDAALPDQPQFSVDIPTTFTTGEPATPADVASITITCDNGIAPIVIAGDGVSTSYTYTAPVGMFPLGVTYTCFFTAKTLPERGSFDSANHGPVIFTPTNDATLNPPRNGAVN